jgi:hypothetical protein
MSDTRAPQQPASEPAKSLKWLRRKWDDIAHDYGVAFADTVEIDAALENIARALAAPAAQQPAEPLTDERIIEIRDRHLPNQGDSFDCIAYARSIERAVIRRLAVAETQAAALAHPPAPSADRLREALRRLWPLIDQSWGGYVFTAERAGEVAADMQTLREVATEQAPRGEE